MMELSHSLTLNEDALLQIPEAKRPIFVFEWLRFLEKVLVAAQQADIKDCQKKLVEQLTRHMQESPGPPTRKLIARCLATLFSVGDTFLLFDTVNKCNDILKNKDDSPSFLPAKLAAICCVGCMYEKLGRMMGRSYEETVLILIRSLRSAESQMRIEIMNTLEKVCAGMGSAISNMHKEIYKACRTCLIDRVMTVRCAASRCLLELLNHSTFMHVTELENLATLCFRAFDASNYEARCAVAKFLGSLVAATQQPLKGNFPVQPKVSRAISLDEALCVLMSGFLRGGTGFLKGTGEMIKGSSGINREVRLGVTHAYVIFVQILGGVWLERNITVFLSHVLDLVANPKAASSHVDAVYSRRCINFILRSVLGKMLGEKAQTVACKEIVHTIVKQMSTIDFNPENAKDCNQETIFSQHLLVCALQELGCLILSLGTSAQILINDQSLNLIEATTTVLLHPCHAARLAAAWCLRCICVAVPSQITPLIDLCVANIEKMRTSPEAISGYSAALAAVLSSVGLSPLGVPHTKGKIIFNTAEELLRSANQNSRLSSNRTQAGWLLIGAIMTLGVPVVRGLLPRMLLLWRNSFPRSNKELESEKARGDAFTWQVTLEGRAGALSAIRSLVLNCPNILTDDILRRLLSPIECALGMLANISTVLKNYGQNVKAPAAMIRLRLYETLLLLPPQSFEGSYTHLLRMLVAEFTLTENQANTTTSLLRSVCHIEESVILGTWLQESDHRTIEDQLQPNSAAGSGALEHDPCCLYRALPRGESVPGPLPLGVAVIDASVQLFGQIFPRVAYKHRLQMLDHFSECIKHSKSVRQEAIQMNVFAAVLSGLKGLTEAKANFGQEDVKKSAAALIMSALISPNPILRCAAAESVGRLAQVIADSRFTAELAQTSFDRLKSARDVASRTGHSLALGWLHRYVGGMGSSQHLNTSVSILLALAQDSSSPIVQVWSLHALALICDSGGPMFRGYVEPTLSLSLKLLLTVPESYVDVHQCVGKLLSSLVTTMGPELQGNTSSICTNRSSFLCACAIMQDHNDPLIQAEATSCLQQLHLFAPRHVNLSSLVPTLCGTLSSTHLLLRKAAMSCLRQLAQREAKEVCEHAMTLANESRETNMVEGLFITDSGLPGVLFSMLDTETDAALIKDIHETLMSMLQVLASDNLSQWLGLCKDVLTISTESTEDAINAAESDKDGDPDADEEDDRVELGAGEDGANQRTVQPRWPTRVFAAECVRRTIAACSSPGSNKAHFDLADAKELQKNKGDFLVLHLSDLIRMSFMAATSDSDPLRLEGLKTLQEIIDKFARVPEPEFPGHLLLEQFQAQVGAALRPAFSPETPAHVTAAACDVCSTWIASSVAKDLNDLRRVHQLLVSSLGKLETKTNSVQLYNESLSTLEKLTILKAWAEIYIVAITGSASDTMKLSKEDNDFKGFEYSAESLLTLVQPQLQSLSKYWFSALHDHALLSLPPEFGSQLPHDGGSFYTTETMESARPHYAASWSSICLAASLWLKATTQDINNIDVDQVINNSSQPQNVAVDDNNGNTNISTLKTLKDRYLLLYGSCFEFLCHPPVSSMPERVEMMTKQILKALATLLEAVWARKLLIETNHMPVELCNVLHRLQLTQENPDVQLLCMQVLKLILIAAQESLQMKRKKHYDDLLPVERDSQIALQELDLLGEGDRHGEFSSSSSIVTAALEICLCVLARHFPVINPNQTTSFGPTLPSSITAQKSESTGKVIATTFNILEILPLLCSSSGALSILPMLFCMTTGVLKECATKDINDDTIFANNLTVQAALHCLGSLVSEDYDIDDESKEKWRTLLKSTLAGIIDDIKTGCENTRLDQVTVMVAIGIFILHAPPEVVTPASLYYPCINHLQQCFDNNNLMVKIKSIQTIRSIFLHHNKKISSLYIRSLTPLIVQSLYQDSARQVTNEMEVTIAMEIIATMDALISHYDTKRSFHMLTILVTILINFLLEPTEMPEANKFSLLLHERSMNWLMKIGPKYPEEFRKLVGQSPLLRGRLEDAIRSNQQSKMKANVEETTTKISQTQPSIKLKTDFSNFS